MLPSSSAPRPPLGPLRVCPFCREGARLWCARAVLTRLWCARAVLRTNENERSVGVVKRVTRALALARSPRFDRGGLDMPPRRAKRAADSSEAAASEATGAGVEDEGGAKRGRTEAEADSAAATDEVDAEAAGGGEGDGDEAMDEEGEDKFVGEGVDEAGVEAGEDGAEDGAEGGEAEGGGGSAAAEGGDGGAGADAYDDTYVPPERDDTHIHFQTRIVNEHLVCTLCMGYFNDACTIIECLHTFCRSCIMRHFREYSVCPQCEMDCGPNPRDIVRTDRTLQSIVDKIFPQFVKQPAPAVPAPAPAAEADDRKPAAAAASSSDATGAATTTAAAAEAATTPEAPEEISFSLHEIDAVRHTSAHRQNGTRPPRGRRPRLPLSPSSTAECTSLLPPHCLSRPRVAGCQPARDPTA